MLRFCSYLVCKNDSLKEFISPNMSQIGAFLTKSQKFGPRSKFSKMLRFCSHLVWWILSLRRFYTPNMSKIGALLTMPKILNPIFLTIRKKVSPNFWYVAWKRLIYPGRDPKVVWNNGLWDLFLIGQVLKLNLELATVPKQLGLGPKFFHLRNHHTG